MAHLRTYAESAAFQQRQPKPRDDAELLQYLPDDWEVVAFPIELAPAAALTLADFFASRANR
jgi:hypothetical protein